MNEQRFGNEIKGLLNQGLDMTPAQLARLARAREQALAHQRVSMLARLGIAPSAVPAWAGRAFGPLGVIGGAHWLVRWMLPLAIVVAALSAISNIRRRSRPRKSRRSPRSTPNY